MPSPSQHAFSEKVALIADVSNPVGKAVAIQLALCGAYVIVAESAETDDSTDIAELKSLGTLSSTVRYQTAGLIAAKEIAASIKDSFGRLDLLVNCINFAGKSSFLQTEPEEFGAKSNDVWGHAYFVTRECLDLMKDRPKPKILNIFPDTKAEAVRKDVLFRMLTSGMAEFTVALCDELDDRFSINGIRVGDGMQPRSGKEELDQELFRRPSGVDPDDVARAALFLLSSEAKAVNGRILDVG